MSHCKVNVYKVRQICYFLVGGDAHIDRKSTNEAEKYNVNHKNRAFRGDVCIAPY